MLYSLVKLLLFTLEPEKAHALALRSLKYYTIFNKSARSSNPIELMGLKFPNRVGLAAGFDKNGAHTSSLLKLGFGFVEIGTLTRKAQRGNDKPRLFRLKEDEAIINRMGFNNHGVDDFIQRFENNRPQGIVGVNIGKNKTTPNDRAIEDYLYGFNKVYSLADYITVNVSSPNTPNLRALETGDALEALLKALSEAKKACQDKHQKHTPLVIKISPDLSEKECMSTAQTLLKYNIDGVVATNTTLNRNSIKSKQKNEIGGLSGKPLKEQSTKTIHLLSKIIDKKFPIIAVGGIFSACDAKEKIQAGASLVQVYSGLIYQGPGLVKQIAKDLE